MTQPDDGNLRRVLGLGLAVAMLLGVAVAGGSIVRSTATEATTRETLPYAAMGAVAAVVLVAIAYAAIRAARPAAVDLRAPEVLAIVFIAAALGALVGSALTPRTPDAEQVSPLDDDELDRREGQSDQFGDATRAGPVDLDGDGRADTDADGEVIVGYDLEGDGRLDGYLQPCPPGTPAPEPRPGYTPIDDDCDGSVDRWLPFDPDDFLLSDSEFVDDPPTTISPEERQTRADSEGADGRRGTVLRKLLLILIAIAIAAAVVVWLVRLPDGRDEEPSDDDLDGNDDPDAVPSPSFDLTGPFEASLDAMLDGPDPRQAICAAYGLLLDGFADAGLPRRPEEGPEEHARRCLATAGMDPGPVRVLLDLFARARFSTHPIGEPERLAAVRAMRAALASAGRTASPRQPAAGAVWSPPGGSA